MTGHFTSYENRTDHELATAEYPALVRHTVWVHTCETARYNIQETGG